MNPSSPDYSDAASTSAPDGLLVVHGELMASNDWELVDGIGAGGSDFGHVADADLGDLAWDGWDLPAPAHLDRRPG
ncbi:hypothetical protein ACTU3I_12790 [Microbacterium sp. RD1]|uniref:hypothetical protein n=1 Tax=Microbacterium sp. RD1 TaxID=3457313 RepID=UPI003FA60B1A